MKNRKYSYQSYRGYRRNKPYNYKIKTIMAFGYYGGKRRIAGEISGILDYANTDEYVELFGGSGAVLLNKIPHDREIYAEKSLSLCCFWKCISEKDSAIELIGRLYDSGNERDDFAGAINVVDEAEKSGKQLDDLLSEDIINIAEACFIVFSMSRDNAGIRFKYAQEGNHLLHLKRINHLVEVADRVRGIEVIHADALELLERFDGTGKMIYMDPVYLPDAGREKSNSHTLYRYNFTYQEHVKLLERVREMDCKVLISGYDDSSRLYARYLLEGEGAKLGETFRKWVRYEMDTISHVGTGDKTRTEVLWANYT